MNGSRPKHFLVRRTIRDPGGRSQWQWWSHDEWTPERIDGETMTREQAEICLEQVKPTSQQDPDALYHCIVEA